MVPNFFIAGAPKAGTTSLYHYLAQHPEIFMSPVKEPSYFSFETRPENFVPELRAKMRGQTDNVRAKLDGGLADNTTRGVVCEWNEYVRLFDGRRSEKVAGEGSVCYLWSKTAAREIAKVSPQAKVVLVLRHPAERAFSQYLHYLSDGHVAHSCSDHIAACLRAGEQLSQFHPFLEFGMYAEQVERFYAYLPREQVRIWLYEETLATPRKFLREVLEFLEVDAGFEPDVSRRYHRMEIPRALAVTQGLRRTGAWGHMRDMVPKRWRPAVKKLVFRRGGSMKLNAEDRAFLVRYYAADVKRLEGVIERDLSAWSR